MTSYARHNQLLAELRIAVRRDSARRMRRRRVTVAAFAAMLVVAATVTAATQKPWWEDAAPPVNPRVVDRQLSPVVGATFPPAADRSRARTVAELDGATLVAAPVGADGGYCLIPALPGSADIGFSCEYELTDEVRTYANPAPEARWIIYGRFTDQRVVTLDLRQAVGTALQVTLQPGGFFIADLPRQRWSDLDEQAARAQLLDSDGRSLRSVCLNFGPSPRSENAGVTRTPSLLDANPCTPRPLIPIAPEWDKARKLVETTLRYGLGIWKPGTTIAIYEAPNGGGHGTCQVVAPVPDRSKRPTGGGMCGDLSQMTTPAHPVNVTVSATRAGEQYQHLVTGQLDRSLDATTVHVEIDGDVFPLALANHRFIGELPPTTSPRPPHGYVIVLNARGVEVARAPL